LGTPLPDIRRLQAEVDRLQRDPLSPNAIGDIFKAAIASTGIKAQQYGPHSLRSRFRANCAGLVRL